jgi:hypothetical protein
MFAKWLVILIFFGIVGSLGSALWYLMKDPHRSPRTIKALTWRIGISIALFFLLIIGYQVGVLHPHGIVRPGEPPRSESSAVTPTEVGVADLNKR